MRRLITTLAILLVVLVAGMTALVLLVNPNDFRGYMARQVEQRSGYKLTIDGDLRWHVWPQLSILSGRITLQAPGAAEPVITADNMRLDVHLLPLISHQLSVKQVMLKNAVLRLTSDSQKQPPANAPVAPGNNMDSASFGDGWSFDIANLRLSDSLVIWQQPDGNELNLRGVNLSMSQNSQRQAHIDFSSQLSRNQRTLQFSLSGDMDVSQYPDRLTATLAEMQYQLSGPDLPSSGVNGKLSLEAGWQRTGEKFSLKNIQLTANDSQLDGSLAGSLSGYPVINATLYASNLNLDTLLDIPAQRGDNGDKSHNPQPRSERPPVIATPSVADNADSPLNKVDGSLNIAMDKLRWRGMNFSDVKFDSNNNKGLLTLSRFEGKSESGDFSLPASINMRGKETLVSLKPDIHDLDVTALLKALELPAALGGKLSVKGTLQGKGMSLQAARRDWQGSASLVLKQAQFSGLNFARMIQQAAQRSDSGIQSLEQDDVGTLQQLSADATLDDGVIDLVNLQGGNDVMTVQGQGEVNMQDRTSDMRFGVTVTGGWQGNSPLIQRLQTTPVPLRIYGSWDNPGYSLQLDDALRNQLKDEAIKRLKQWETNQKKG